jgi:hypothetical protein
LIGRERDAVQLFTRREPHIESETIVGDIDPSEPEPDLEAEKARAGRGPSVDALVAALKEIWWSANSDSAITYRQRVHLFTRPVIGVVVQRLLNPEADVVMFNKNLVTRADARVIEASWGLGAGVVAGLVIPDHFRLDLRVRYLAQAGPEADRDPQRP